MYKLNNRILSLLLSLAMLVCVAYAGKAQSQSVDAIAPADAASMEAADSTDNAALNAPSESVFPQAADDKSTASASLSAFPVEEEGGTLHDELASDTAPQPLMPEAAPESPSVREALSADGYAYALLSEAGSVYASPTLSVEDCVFHADKGGIVLCTGILDHDAFIVWLILPDERVLSGYMAASCLAEAALTSEQVNERTEISRTSEVETPAGRRILFEVTGVVAENDTVDAQAPVDEIPPASFPDNPAPDESSAVESPVDEVPPALFPDNPVSDESEAAELSGEGACPELPVQPGGFLAVTPSTRAFLGVAESEISSDDLWQGYFVCNATVQVLSHQWDAEARLWYQVAYLYGSELADGSWKWTEVDKAWVLAEETESTDECHMSVTDTAFQTVPAMRSARLFSATPMNGFALKDISVSLGDFYAWQKGLYGSSGKDSAYPQIAKSAAHGTIYATPHYLSGYTVYCLEHTMDGPGEGGGSTPTGPYILVDMDTFISGAEGGGVTGTRFSASTMHAIGWVLRHCYPFMALDRSDSNNLVWSRVAGQFAVREVIKQLEGAQYVRSYWNMDSFYRASGQAPAVYLEYARWLARNGINRAGITGRITFSNQGVSVTDNGFIGSVTLTTDADLIRIPRSTGSVTGNTGGTDRNYYYAKSGDTIRVTSSQSRFTVSMESVSSDSEEANFLIGIPSVRIQKVLVPTYGAPYALEAASVTFELSGGEIEVTKKSVDGKLLAGAVFELLDSAGTICGTAATDASGKAAFTNLTPGNYVVREKTAPQGYALAAVSAREVTVTAGVSTPVAFTNEPVAGKLRIVKTDSITGKPLPGATFSITRLSCPDTESASDVGHVVAVITTNAQGIAETGALPWGKYRIEETGVPEGYLDSGCVEIVQIQ